MTLDPDRKVFLQKLAIFCVAAITTSLFFIDWCNFTYQCGCRSLWNGAAAACNIHVPGIPHCPWCVHGGVGGLVAYVSMVVPQGLISFWPGELAFRWRLVGALLAFPAMGTVTGLIAGWLTGYWAS